MNKRLPTTNLVCHKFITWQRLIQNLAILKNKLAILHAHGIHIEKISPHRAVATKYFIVVSYIDLP